MNSPPSASPSSTGGGGGILDLKLLLIFLAGANPAAAIFLDSFLRAWTAMSGRRHTTRTQMEI